VTVDVADRASVTAAIAEVSETFGRVDVCINAAGIPNPGKVFGKSGPLEIEQFQRVIDVNLVGAFDVMRKCAELMTRNISPGLDGERGGHHQRLIRRRVRGVRRARRPTARAKPASSA